VTAAPWRVLGGEFILTQGLFMPELPEVEVTRRGIDEPLRGARVLDLRLGKPLRWPLGVDAQAVCGRVLGPVQRRGKYLWLPLFDLAPDAQRDARPDAAASGAAVPDAPAAGGLLLHLGMSGSLALLPTAAAPPPGPHDHFDLITSRGTLRLNDPRRFGAVVWAPALDAAPAEALLARLGPEPFDPALSPQVFHAALHRHRAAVKTVLLSGTVVVGAGNIYACEALHQAGIHPALRSDRISRPRAARLLQAVRDTLARALALGGTTLRDFSDAHGMSGAFQHAAAVYGREGLACPRCGGTVQRRVQAQRSTYFCAGCQRR
jgi:formamidopyrimidine-DNA glycosylase